MDLEPSSFVDVGSNIPDEIEDPTDLFITLYSKELLDTLVFQTNLFATQKHLTDSNKFTPTTLEELKCFFWYEY